MKQKSIGVNAILNGGKTVLTMLFPLVTFPYVSRVLQSENLGKYNFSQSIITYFIMIAGLGISQYAIREGAKYRDNREKYENFASEVFSINIISSLISYVLLFICVFNIGKLYPYRIMILIFSLEIFFTTIGTEWIFSTFEEYGYITVRSIVFKVISMLLLFLFVKNADDYLKYAGITVFANVGANSLNYFYLKKRCQLHFTLKCNWKRHLPPVLIMFASSIAIQIYVNSDITMLGLMCNDKVVGIYTVAAKIYNIVKNMLSAVLVVIIPRAALLLGQNKHEEYKKLIQDILNALIVLVVPAVVGLFCLSQEIVDLIAGFGYEQANSSLRLLSIALLFCLMGWLFNDCVLIPARKEKIVLMATTISAIANMAINLVLIPLFAENAAAFSTIIAEAIMMIICVYEGNKVVKLNDHYIWKNIMHVISGCILIILVCLAVRNLFVNSVMRLIIGITGSILIYGVWLLLLKNTFIVSSKNKILSKLNK